MKSQKLDKQRSRIRVTTVIFIIAVLVPLLVGGVTVWQRVSNAVGFAEIARALAWPNGLAAIWALGYMYTNPAGPLYLKLVRAIFGGLFFGLAWFGVAQCVILIVGRAIDLVRSLPSPSARPVGTGLTLLAALMLFGFRYYARAFWGLGEVMVALYAAWQVMPQDALREWDIPKSFTAPVIAGSLYLAIRGLDNIQQGYAKDKLLQWLRTGAGRLRWRR